MVYFGNLVGSSSIDGGRGFVCDWVLAGWMVESGKCWIINILLWSGRH